MKRDITEEMVESVYEFLEKHKALDFFRRVKEARGRVSCVITEFLAECYYGNEHVSAKGTAIPHPIHFREGMWTRNHLRRSGLCTTWTDHDLDDNWEEIVERAIADDNS